MRTRSKFPYVSSDFLAICDRCSRKFYRSELRHDGHFTALLVCSTCYDPRHPQLDVRSPANIQVPDEARPERTDVFHTGAVASEYPKSF